MLEVHNLGRAERFYTELLGLRVIARPSSERVWLLVGDGTQLGLWLPQVGIAGGRGGVNVHYAIAVSESDYDLSLGRLRQDAYEPHEEKLDAGRALYVTDPDGNVVELNTKHAAGELGG